MSLNFDRADALRKEAAALLDRLCLGRQEPQHEHFIKQLDDFRKGGRRVAEPQAKAILHCLGVEEKSEAGRVFLEAVRAAIPAWNWFDRHPDQRPAYRTPNGLKPENFAPSAGRESPSSPATAR